MNPGPAALLLVLTASPAFAQSERALRDYFEGQTVHLRIDMPGTQQGVDVHPARAHPVDFSTHAGRLKRYGTALRRGEEALVTKIKVKEELIEFQLGGGGYGTFGDEGTYVNVPLATKTTREKNLEKELERTRDSTRRREIREELDGLKREREREDTRNRIAAAQAEQAKEANIRQRRLESGSRFNLRYSSGVPREALTPEAVMHALAAYVEFPSNDPPAGPPGEASREPAGEGGLRKGLTVEEVDALLGRPDAISERREGSLTVSTSIYRQHERRVTAEFVEGVLIRFTVAEP
jgi:hypothetical protein